MDSLATPPRPPCPLRRGFIHHDSRHQVQHGNNFAMLVTTVPHPRVGGWDTRKTPCVLYKIRQFTMHFDNLAHEVVFIHASRGVRVTPPRVSLAQCVRVNSLRGWLCASAKPSFRSWPGVSAAPELAGRAAQPGCVCRRCSAVSEALALPDDSSIDTNWLPLPGASVRSSMCRPQRRTHVSGT